MDTSLRGIRKIRQKSLTQALLSYIVDNLLQKTAKSKSISFLSF